MALRRGLHPVQRRHHPHGPDRDERHRHVRRHRSQPAHIPRPPSGAALRLPQGWGAVRRFRRGPLERPRGSRVVLRGPACLRVGRTKAVAAVAMGVKRREGAKPPFYVSQHVQGFVAVRSDVPVRGAALRQPQGWGAVRRFRREPQERPRESQVEHRGPHIRSILSTRSLRHNYPPRQPVRGQATAQPKIKPSTRP